MHPRISITIALCLASLACTVSDEQEVAIGEHDAAEINTQLPLLDDPRITGYVQQLGQAIAAKTSRSDLAWHFYVVNTNEVNAFALPGGFIYVNRGLIEQSERLDQLAGTLGHEIGHVVRRHAVDQMKKQTGANIGISLACTLTKICQHTGAQVVINAAGSALFAKYSRHDEFEADSEAVVNVVNAGIDPRGIPELFQILLRERQRAPNAPRRILRVASAGGVANRGRAPANRALRSGKTRGPGRRRRRAFTRSRPRWRAFRRHRHRNRSTRGCHEHLLIAWPIGRASRAGGRRAPLDLRDAS